MRHSDFYPLAFLLSLIFGVCLMMALRAIIQFFFF
jgi:hypothetical protein